MEEFSEVKMIVVMVYGSGQLSNNNCGGGSNNAGGDSGNDNR